MLFNSLHFFIFFLVVTTMYYMLSHSKRWVLLLLSSCYFYMAFVPIYLLILLFTIIVDYFAGIYIDKSVGEKRKIFLIFSLIANISVLAIFKYYNFINENFTFLLHGFTIENPLPYLNILLPIGLSFHTFQAMSYTIEIYYGRQKVEKHFGIYALYVMFYPQLVAGPIERPQNLLHQFKEEHHFDYNRVTSGLRLMAWGLFKKVVIADRLAILVNQVYDNPSQYSSLDLSIATVLFAYQIFCDFSGYSDIAIGAARVMGFKLMTNFNMPYHSRSIHEFWKRWHISLSTWFKDYLYIPLGGNRVNIPRWYLNLFIVFLVSGIWHGANWTFAIWGALHGFYLVFSLIIRSFRTKINQKLHLDKLQFFSIITTFILVCFAWIFFRAENIQIAKYIAKHIVLGIPQLVNDLVLLKTGLDNDILIKGLLLIVFLEIAHLLQRKINILDILLNKGVIFRWSIYTLLVFILVFYGVYGESQFIYFQF